MSVPKANVTAKVKKRDGYTKIEVTSDRFGHFVYLDLPDGAVATDNYFNLLPSRRKVIRVTGCDIDEVAVGALNLARAAKKGERHEKG